MLFDPLSELLTTTNDMLVSCGVTVTVGVSRYPLSPLYSEDQKLNEYHAPVFRETVVDFD